VGNLAFSTGIAIVLLVLLMFFAAIAVVLHIMTGVVGFIWALLFPFGIGYICYLMDLWVSPFLMIGMLVGLGVLTLLFGAKALSKSLLGLLV